MSHQYVCYFLRSCQPTSKCTYVGITNNLKRRLRQHNGEICGGARYTRRARPWEHFIIVKGFIDKSEVLSFEWHIKHKRKKNNRILTLEWHISQPRWQHLSVEVYMKKSKYMKIVKSLTHNITYTFHDES